MRLDQKLILHQKRLQSDPNTQENPLPPSEYPPEQTEINITQKQ
jgi:hypothetical protein